MKSHGSLNRAYRLVWSELHNAWVVAAETARGRGKGSGRKLVAAALSLSAGIGQAAPIGGQVVAGAGSISQSGATTTIKQSSQNLSLTWKSFNIAPQETVNFQQPSASSLAVNRIFDTNGTQILGRLNANGQVWLINPNGVLFGPGAQVNVGGLVASTLDLNDATLNSNSRNFSGKGTGSVINQGTINAATGGYVALLGNKVSNQGTITAKLGTVALGAGSATTLTFSGNSLVKMQVDESVLNSVAENGGLIRADGGMVVMTAGAKDALLASVVNNTGIIEARTVEQREGVIILGGGMQAGTVNVGGTLDASASSPLPQAGEGPGVRVANGGFIETSAAQVNVANDAKVTTAASMGLAGTWLIDPVDYTIAATGGNITGATLGTNLGSGNVTIASTSGTTGTSGDVNVNDTVTWSANKLTLNAQNNININSVMNGSGTAKLALEYGQSAVAAGNTSDYNVKAAVNLPAGNNFSTKLGSNGTVKNYTVITSLGAQGSTTGTDLQGMGGNSTNLAKNYALGRDIDASATSTWNGGAGFNPLGTRPATGGTPYTGTLDGLGHVISGLTIVRGSEIGFFGAVGASGVVRNIGLVNGSVTGSRILGSLAARNYGTITNSYNTGTVSGTAVGGTIAWIGGLVGINRGGTISNSYATGTVSAPLTSMVGGLVGSNGSGGNSSNSRIINSFATGAVTAAGYAGGLVGNQYTSGNSISNSYATGSVTQTGSYGIAGGLVGFNGSSISNSYALGTVTGTSNVGGLVGKGNGGTVSTSYSVGSVTGNSNVGGLVGNGGTATNSYWNTTTSGKTTSAGGTGARGLTDAQFKTASNFSNFTFTTTPGAAGWVIVDADGSLNNTNQFIQGSVAGATYPMLASEYSTNITNAHQLQLMAMAMGRNVHYNLGANIDAAATGLINGRSTDVWGSGGFVPIGVVITGVGSLIPGFTFDGLGHIISNLTINRPTAGAAGLFADAIGTIRNVGLVGGSVSGGNSVGALVGINYGTISNSYATASVSGTGSQVGGLVGLNYGTVRNTYATGSASGASRVGGLVGYNNYGTVSDSYATGSVSGASGVGGLVGDNSNGTVSNSFWNRDVKATGIGGGTTTGAAGLTTAQMMTQANFNSATAANGNVNPAWDIANTGGSTSVWRIYEGSTAPLLRSFLTPLTVTANNLTKTYDNVAFSGGNGVTYSLTPNSNLLLGTLSYGGTSQGATNVGSNYVITPGGLYSNQQGYDISYANGTLTINSGIAVISLTGTRAYDGTTVAASSIFTLGGLQSGQNLTLTGSGTISSKNVGTYTNTNNTFSLGTLALGNGTGNNAGLASNYTLTGGTDTVTITRKTVTLSASKIYDRTTGLAGAVTVGTGISGETLSYSGATASNANVATAGKFINAITLANGTGGVASNYQLPTLNSTNAPVTITAKALTVTGESAANKVYDSTTTATLSGGSLVGVISGDTVTLTHAGNFASKNVGNNITVNANDSLGGAAAPNYTLTQPAGLAANITPASLAVTGVTAGNKVYDATTTATLGGTAAVSAFAGDTVTVVGANSSGSFADKNVGNDKAVTVSGFTLSGAAASNYTIVQPTGVTANITPKALTVTGQSAADKVYDGTTTATLTGGTLSGVIGTENVTLTQAGNFATANAGSTIAVTAANSLDGTGASNYTVTQPTGLAANITKAALTVTANNASTFVTQADPSGYAGVKYDGFVNGETSAVTGGTLAITRSNTATAAGIYSGVLSPSGLTAANYSFNYVNGDFTIIPAGQLAIKVTNASTTYGSAASLTPTSVQYLNNSSVLTNLTQSSANGNTYSYSDGAGGSVTFTLGTTGATSTSGNVKAGNYAVTSTSFSQVGNNFSGTPVYTGNLAVNPLLATLSASGVTKVYDGTISASGATAAISNKLTGDVVTVGSSSGSFGSKNVGTNVAYTLNGLSLSGTDSTNYYLGTTTSLSGTGAITPAPLAVSGITAANKVYDGTTAATVITAAAAYTGLVTGDAVTVSATGAFNNKNAATGKTVTLTSSYTGGDVGNYTITDQATTTANITPVALTIATSSVTKTYDGSLTAAGTAVAAGGTQLFADDSLSGGTFAFTNANAGSNKTVTATAVTVNDGNNGANYTVTYANNTASTINPASLTVSTGSVTKTYDGTLSAAGAPVVTSGTLYANASNNNTQDSLSGGTFAFTNANAGTNKTVTTAEVTVNDGNNGGNYSVTYANNTTSTINRANLTVSTSDVTRTYDGTLAAAGTAVVTSGTLYTNASNNNAQDSLSGGTFAFGNANAGTNKTVTTTGVTISDGNNGGNYNVTYANNTSSTINRANLTVSTSDVTKTYDGTLTAAGTPVVTSGTLYTNASNNNAQDNLSGGTFAYTDANAGFDKTVTTTAVTINDGNSGGNYNVTYANNTSSTINPANLTVSTSDVTKTYDGTLTATGAPVVASGTLYTNASNNNTQDSLSGGTFAFTDKNVGSGNKTVTAIAEVTVNDGNNGGNYNINYANNTTSTINPATLAVTGVTASNKVYDATRTATLGGTAAIAPLTGDSVTVVGTNSSGVFADKNVGNNKAVTVSGFSLSGTDSGNYTILQPTGVTANITAANLAVTGVTASDKVYDATTTATLGGTAAVAPLTGDTVAVVGTNSSGTFADKNVGTDKAVTISGFTISGADSGNYAILQPTGVTANITPATLTYNATPASFTAGQAPSGLSGTVSGFAAGDTLAGSATGTLAWTTTASLSSPPGQYPIDGGGLTALNYVFAQATGNTTALTLNRPLDVARTILESMNNNNSNDNNNNGNSNTPIFINTSLLLGAGLVPVQIINGGVRMPPDFINPN